MKYKERDELVKDLREMADFIEDRGLELPIVRHYPFTLRTHFFESDDVSPRENMRRVAKNIGFADKRIFTDDLEIVKTFGSVRLIFETAQENVCTRRVVGTKQVQKVEVREIPGAFVVEDIVEWDCEPLLKPGIPVGA